MDEPSLRGYVSHQLYMTIYNALDREGIEIPFPQRDLWVRRLPDSTAVAAGSADGAVASDRNSSI